MSPDALAREGWWYAAAGTLAFTVGGITLGLAPAMYATAVAVIVFLAVLLITRGETRRLKAALGRADDELDDYDALRDLAAAVVDTRSGTCEERAALRALRDGRPDVGAEVAS